jgi:hypothetical protein
MEAQPFVPRYVCLLSATGYDFLPRKATIFGGFLEGKSAENSRLDVSCLESGGADDEGREIESEQDTN